MFDEIHRLAKSHNLKMSTYVDDVSISGARVSRSTRERVQDIIRRAGLVGHKERLAGSTAFVTGTIVTLLGLRLPNRRRQECLAGITRLKVCRKLRYRILHLRRLVGQLWAAAELDSRLKKPAREYTAHLHGLYETYPECVPRSRKRRQSIVRRNDSKP